MIFHVNCAAITLNVVFYMKEKKFALLDLYGVCPYRYKIQPTIARNHPSVLEHNPKAVAFFPDLGINTVSNTAYMQYQGTSGNYII